MKDTKAMTQAERTRKHRERRKESGLRMIQVYLEKRSWLILENTKDKYKMTTTQAMNHIIQDD